VTFRWILICTFTIMSVSGVSGSQKRLLDSAWTKLLDNEPIAAREIFRNVTGEKEPRISAQAYRGLGVVEAFLGNNYLSGLCFIDAFSSDKDLLRFSARPDFYLSEGNLANPEYKKRDEVLLKLASSNGLFNGWYQDALLQRYLNDGELKKAQKMLKKMGVITDWQFIGPFDNISNCGIAKKYEPEINRDYSREYEGKNGNSVKWHKLQMLTPNGWVFIKNHGTEENAVYYFHCTINSPQIQEVILSFGASGAFEVFLNGNTVLLDPVFRNTGIDSYLQKVKLNKGPNDLLVKIGHEMVYAGNSNSRYSNFMLRFLDKSYNPLTNIETLSEVASYKPDSTVYQNIAPSPVLDSISNVLKKSLKEDSTNFDALFSLVALFNIYERTNEAQLIVQQYLKKYPNSSILYSLLAESLVRAQKNTEYEVAMKKAFDLCKLNRSAWERQLRLEMAKGNPRSLNDFLSNSPEEFKKTPQTAIAYLTAAIQQKNGSEILNRMTELKTFHGDNLEVINLLVNLYVSQGNLQKASQLLSDYISVHRNADDAYIQAAQLEIKQGNLKKGIEILLNAIKYNPSGPVPYLQLSNIYYNQKKYSEALSWVDKCLGIIPTSSTVLNLKGNILASLNRKEEAIETFLQTVKYTSDDFTAWESIRELRKQKSFEKMTPLPDVDSLIDASAQWIRTVPEKAALISCIEDVYLYPSRCSASRVFFVVHLPNQNQIDIWKEYQIPFNPNYQQLNIERALSRKKDGSEISADYQSNYVVFKSLEPGDCIILEYNLKDYYEGVMAGKVYGKQEFYQGIPYFDTRIRLVAPSNDTIPFKIVGDSIKVETTQDQDYRITTISSKPYTSENAESFCPAEHPSYPKAFYSNFNDWGQISDWYYELSRHKQNQTIELKSLADSLFNKTTNDWEKALKIHEYITRNINYSFVSFRQSGWVPQAAKDVLATRIGDCKDMASLGKCLMDIAGIKSWLVLVNTGIHHFTDHAFIGPNFDHCILQFETGGKTTYVDFTDRNTALGRLPSADQGAMALVIKPGNREISVLPTDTPEDRLVRRDIIMQLDTNGTLKQTMKTFRRGIFASQLRSIYRFQNENERKTDLHRAISIEHPDVTVDTMWFDNLESVVDSISFTYSITARNAANVNGNTVIYSLKLPDILGSGYYPVEQNRKNPVDLSSSFIGIVKLESDAELCIPENWKLIDEPKNMAIKTENMNYSLQFKLEKGKIRVLRRLTCNYNRIFASDEFASEQDALMQVAKSDDVKLIFNRK